MYSLGIYMGDYPEQALLTNIVQGWCAKYVHYVSFNTWVNMQTDVSLPQKTLMPLDRASVCACIPMQL